MTMQLRLAAQLLEQPEQPAQVHVVERGLHLVHHIERRRPRPEDRHQHRDRGQRLLAAGQQRQPLDLLARRASLDLDAGGQHVVGIGQQQPALATGEQRRKHFAELAFHVGVGLGEHLQDARVDVVDDVEQILAGRLDVLELGGQEVVALLQRGELLQRKRIDAAQLVELALGLLGAALLGGPVERHRRGRGHLFAAFARLLVLGHLQLRRRQRDVGAVLGDQVGGRHPELLEDVLLELLDAKCRLGFGDLVAVQRVGECGDLGAQFVDLFARLRQRARPVLTFGGDLVAGPRRDRHRGAQPLRDKTSGLRHRGRNRRGVLARLAGALRTQPGLALGGRGPAQRIRPSANGIRAFFGGAHGQPRLHLGGAGRLGRGRRLLPVDGFGFERRLLLGVVQPLLEFGEFLDGLVAAGLQLVALLDEPLPLVVGGAGVLAEPAELLVDRRDRGVGLVERGQRLLGGVLAGRLLGQRTGQRGRQLAGLLLRRGQFARWPSRPPR